MGAFTGAKSAVEGTGICSRPAGWYHRKNQKCHAVCFGKIQKTLMQPEVKQAGKEQIQKKAKRIHYRFLNQSKQDSARSGGKPEKQQQKKTGYGTLRHPILKRNWVPFVLSGGENFEYFEVVKQSVSTRQAAEFYNPCPEEWDVVCPFHDDRNPSMKVDRRFHCFGCQADGDVIDFAARLFDLNLKEPL